MTCIAGYADKGNVWIGGDSAGVAGYFYVNRADEKVFIKDNMIFGFTSSFRMGQIIRYCFNIPEHSPKKTDYEYLCSTFIDALMKCFKNKGFSTILNNVATGGQFLLGYRGNLYNISRDFQVGKNRNNYDACGCGDDFALGALHAMNRFEDLRARPERLIKFALEAAVEFSAGVRPPFEILKLPEAKNVKRKQRR